MEQLKRSIICDDIPGGLKMVKAELEGGKFFQVDICQGGVIQTVQRFGADAYVRCETVTANTMYCYVNSYCVRMFSPLRIQWMDPGTDPYYLIVVWLSSGLEAVFYIWA